MHLGKYLKAALSESLEPAGLRRRHRSFALLERLCRRAPAARAGRRNRLHRPAGKPSQVPELRRCPGGQDRPRAESSQASQQTVRPHPPHACRAESAAAFPNASEPSAWNCGRSPLDLKRPGMGAVDVPLDQFQVTGLDRLLWIHLRLLYTQYALSQFLQKTSAEQIQKNIDKLAEADRPTAGRRPGPAPPAGPRGAARTTWRPAAAGWPT